MATASRRSFTPSPDAAGNFMEVIWLELDDKVDLVIHAMALRPAFYNLLPTAEDDHS